MLQHRAAAANIDFYPPPDRKTRKLIDLQRKVSKTFTDRPLFRDVNLTLSPGTKLGLLGPNGSGTSTLIKLLTDKLQPDTGQISKADQLAGGARSTSRAARSRPACSAGPLSPVGDSLIFQGNPDARHRVGETIPSSAATSSTSSANASGGEQARVSTSPALMFSNPPMC